MAHAVILFPSSNVTLWAAKLLKKAKIDHKIITVPRELSSDCGYCLRIFQPSITEARNILDAHHVEYADIIDLTI